MNILPPLPWMMSVRYCGRDFTLEDLIEIRAISAAQPHRAAIARAVSQHLGWYKPDGGLKSASCALALRRMHADGWIDLPPPVHPAPPPPKAPAFTAASDPQPRIEGARGDLAAATAQAAFNAGFQQAAQQFVAEQSSAQRAGSSTTISLWGQATVSVSVVVL